MALEQCSATGVDSDAHKYEDEVVSDRDKHDDMVSSRLILDMGSLHAHQVTNVRNKYKQQNIGPHDKITLLISRRQSRICLAPSPMSLDISDWSELMSSRSFHSPSV